MAHSRSLQDQQAKELTHGSQKSFIQTEPISPGVAKVSADSYNSLTFKLYADGSLKHTQTVTNSNIFRLPGGYQAKAFHIILEGTDPVNEVCVYESPQGDHLMGKVRGTFVVPRAFDREAKRFATIVNDSIAQIKGEKGDPLDVCCNLQRFN